MTRIKLSVLLFILCACVHAAEKPEGKKSESSVAVAAKEAKSSSTEEVIKSGSAINIKSTKQDWLIQIESVIGYYNSVPGLKMKMKKREVLELLEEEKDSAGTFLFSKGKVKYEITTPEWNLVVMNQKQITIATKLPADFGGTIQVSIIKSAGLAKKTTAPIVLLISDPKSWNQFELVAKETKKNKSYYSLVPKKDAKLAEIKKIKLSLLDNNRIEALTYEDTLGNKSIFSFSNIEIMTSVNATEFEYTPPKGSEVSYH